MSANLSSDPTPAELFAWWCDLRTPATLGTTLADWEAVPYRDAWCFFRGGRRDHEAYLIRGNGLIHFGRDQDTMESAYRMLSPQWRPHPVETRVVQRWLAWVSE